VYLQKPVCAEMKICLNCGHTNEEEIALCSKCGGLLIKEVQTESVFGNRDSQTEGGIKNA